MSSFDGCNLSLSEALESAGIFGYANIAGARINCSFILHERDSLPGTSTEGSLARYPAQAVSRLYDVL